MRALFIGGTGTISSAITRQLAAQGWTQNETTPLRHFASFGTK